MAFSTNLAPALSTSDQTNATVAVSPDGRIFYTWWRIGEVGPAWREIDGGGHTDAAPVASLTGEHLLVIVKGLDGHLYFNQGKLGSTFVGWQRME